MGGYDFMIYFAESKHALESIPNETNISYGGRDGQKLDIFYPKSQGKGRKCHAQLEFFSFYFYQMVISSW